MWLQWKILGWFELFVCKGDKLNNWKKNKFEECYYFKYYKYGNNCNVCCREDVIYKLINPMSMIKNYVQYNCWAFILWIQKNIVLCYVFGLLFCVNCMLNN